VPPYSVRTSEWQGCQMPSDATDIPPRPYQTNDKTSSSVMSEVNQTRQAAGYKQDAATKPTGGVPDHLDFSAPIYPEQNTPKNTNSNAAKETNSDSKSDAGDKVNPKSDVQSKDKLPTHLQQTDKGAGTQDNPINNNCQTTTLKNVFNFYGKDSEAGKVNDWQKQMLDDVRDNHGKNIDSKSADEAFKNDKVDPEKIKRAINAGQLDGFFQYDYKEGNLKGSAASPETATLFLSEMGCKPEQHQLGTQGEADKVKAALDSGKPVMLADNDTTTLLMRATTKPGDPLPPPEPGHVYMAYKKDGQYYVSDPSCPVAVKVSEQTMKDKLMDGNSTATIINAPPDPDKFLKH
jgi:hypothetical protein